jgi:hypothetical protein
VKPEPQPGTNNLPSGSGIFSHPDYTVGIGFSPILQSVSFARGLLPPVEEFRLTPKIFMSEIYPMAGKSQYKLRLSVGDLSGRRRTQSVDSIENLIEPERLPDYDINPAFGDLLSRLVSLPAGNRHYRH